MEQETLTINGKTYKSSQVLNYDLVQMKEKNIYDDYRNANYKYMSFDVDELGEKKVILLQNHALNKGGIFWDGSYLLIKYFLKIEQSWKKGETTNIPVRILELGAGTGFPSIVAGHLGYQVVTTDLPFLLPFVESNIYENIPRGQNVEVKNLEWGNEEHMKAIPGKFDYIFAAELVYLEDTFDNLVATLKHYCDEKTKVIMTYKMRLPERTQLFTSKFEEHFDIEYIDGSSIREILPNPNMYLLVAKLKSK